MANNATPSAGYKFNTFEEIKSHSSILYNQRMAILFWLLDTKAISMNTTYDINMAREVRAFLKQIYKNIRMLIRYNPLARSTLSLETKQDGIYVTDVMFGLIDKMFEYIDINGVTTRRVYTIIQELNNLEMLLKDVLQYFHYFIRPDFRQKPDVENATEKYKEMADKQTVEELKEIVGKNCKINFDNLGSSRIEIQDVDGFDEELDEEEISINDSSNYELLEQVSE